MRKATVAGTEMTTGWGLKTFTQDAIDMWVEYKTEEEINAVKPNILIVGFGMPLQERWLLENWERVEANVALTGGGVFDILSGKLRRPPRWMTDHSLEWLGRLIIEPRQLNIGSVVSLKPLWQPQLPGSSSVLPSSG